MLYVMLHYSTPGLDRYERSAETGGITRITGFLAGIAITCLAFHVPQLTYRNSYPYTSILDSEPSFSSRTTSFSSIDILAGCIRIAAAAHAGAASVYGKQPGIHQSDGKLQNVRNSLDREGTDENPRTLHINIDTWHQSYCTCAKLARLALGGQTFNRVVQRL